MSIEELAAAYAERNAHDEADRQIDAAIAKNEDPPDEALDRCRRSALLRWHRWAVARDLAGSTRTTDSYVMDGYRLLPIEIVPPDHDRHEVRGASGRTIAVYLPHGWAFSETVVAACAAELGGL